jgi:hypothetical protein
VRRTLLLGTTILILSLSAAGALAMPTGGTAARVAYDEQSADIRGLTWSGETQFSAPPVFREAAMQSSASDAGSGRKDIVPLLRAALLLGIAGMAVGFGAVGVKSLWVAEESEYAALSLEPRDEIPAGCERATLTCLGDYPA